MNETVPSRRSALLIAGVALALLLVAPNHAQQRGAPAGPPPTAKAAAPVDLTGYWVSVVSEDWRLRMITPQKGDYPGIPLNAAARRVADAWDPAKDEAAGNQCKGYAAPNIMREPGRFHITWENDNTLKMEIDSGTQTRLFQFGNPPAPTGEPTWQGYSVARWEPTAPPRRGAKSDHGSLKVVTTHIRPGYVRKNGIPFSENTVFTEYYDIIKGPSGEEWLAMTSEVNDPMYLTQPFIISTQYKKQADAKGWNPTPCSAK